MQFNLNYGRQGLLLNLPDDWQIDVVRKKAMPVLDDPADAVRRALENPVGCGGLAAEAAGKKSVCILMCDITRPVPNGLILPVLIKDLLAAGVVQEDILILVATGLHRPNEGRELREVVGDDWVFENIRIENHFARRNEDHVHLGTTSRGTPVKLDRRLVEADLRIITGLVEPHFMAGYSGGRKVITPGVAHQDTITYLHNAGFMGHPSAANCVLEGNPLHQEQIEIVGMLGGALAVNVVIDDERRLSYVNFGEIVKSHLEAVEYMRPYAEVHLPGRYHTVVTSSAGYPLDKTYYQTIKGMVAAMEILEPGGDLFIVSEISEGLGSSEYVESQKKLIELGPEKFWQEIESKKFAAIDEWETQEQLKAMGAGQIHLFTRGLSPEEGRLTGVDMVQELEQAVLKSAQEHKKLAVIPEGPYLVPFGPGRDD